ncbi:hypothetical protein ES702_06951 [subsurface metagenome]
MSKNIIINQLTCEQIFSKGKNCNQLIFLKSNNLKIENFNFKLKLLIILIEIIVLTIC